MSSRARGVFSFSLAALCLFLTGCARQDESSDNQLKNQQGPRDACSLLHLAEKVLGPAEFRRATGKPQTETAGFEVPERGEVCIIVVNGSGPPPHGERISAAWLSIDGVLVIGPEAFSQNVGEISAPHAVEAGAHRLSVKLASVPGSFISVEIRFLPEDTEPPVVSLQPASGEVLDTDLPFLRVAWRDDGVGVDLASLQIRLNEWDVTDRFIPGDGEATWQVGIDDYLEEGLNGLSVSLADRLGNEAFAFSIFLVVTPTEVLLSDLTHDDWRYRQRSAYKLLYRLDEITQSTRRRCLKQLNETAEPKAAERLLFLVRANDHLSRALAAGALGGAAGASAAAGWIPRAVEALSAALFEDPSWSVKAASARALGLTGGEEALGHLVRYIEHGPVVPRPPPGCVLDDDVCLVLDGPYGLDCCAFKITNDNVDLQAIRAAIRIAGQDYNVGNPGTLEDARRQRVANIQRNLESISANGGRP